jgi:ABC-type dipeptide/oligopeptide/nickel transport system ATPase component
MTPLLDIRDLRLSFKLWSGPVEVLHGISLSIARGERVALVGESGSGKSVTARLVLGLIQDMPGARVSGGLTFDGQDLTRMTRQARHALRGTAMSMIFQDPTSSLNPVIPIARQFREVLSRATPGISRDDSHARAAEALREVAITEADRVLASYPFQLSGGMNQRVMIAMALANRPKLLVADEPGTALDVTVQAQTLDLMHRLVTDHETAVLFISHNLGVVREFADRTYVIYRGRIVETGPTAAVFADPRHAYTRALMAAQPRLTSAGLPDIPERDPAFNDPMEVHA